MNSCLYCGASNIHTPFCTHQCELEWDQHAEKSYRQHTPGHWSHIHVRKRTHHRSNQHPRIHHSPLEMWNPENAEV